MTHPPLKQAVGEAAAALVEDGMRLGLGTGSTVAAFLDAVASRRRGGELADLAGVPTSEATARACRRLGIPLLTTDDQPRLDLVVDGADELTTSLALTKGGGGALLREKVVAAMGDRFAVIASEDKIVTRLGDSFALPVEVVPFAVAPVTAALWHFGEPRRRHRDGEPVLTDNGNAIVDLRVTGGITDPERVARALSVLPGVAEHGLFLGLASEALISHVDPDGTVSVRTIASA